MHWCHTPLWVNGCFQFGIPRHLTVTASNCYPSHSESLFSFLFSNPTFFNRTSSVLAHLGSDVHLWWVNQARDSIGIAVGISGELLQTPSLQLQRTGLRQTEPSELYRGPCPVSLVQPWVDLNGHKWIATGTPFARGARRSLEGMALTTRILQEYAYLQFITRSRSMVADLFQWEIHTSWTLKHACLTSVLLVVRAASG